MSPHAQIVIQVLFATLEQQPLDQLWQVAQKAIIVQTEVHLQSLHAPLESTELCKELLLKRKDVTHARLVISAQQAHKTINSMHAQLITTVQSVRLHKLHAQLVLTSQEWEQDHKQNASTFHKVMLLMELH